MFKSEKENSLAGISGLIMAIGIILVCAMPAAADLTVEPITWNIIGLDSSDVSVGPNQFPVGVRVKNNGGANATNVVATFLWDSSNSYIDLYPPTATTSTIGTIVAGGYKDAYFTVEVDRNAAVFTPPNNARRYHINVTANSLPAVSTPIPRELRVEPLIAGSRSRVSDVKLNGVTIPPGGTMNLMVGTSYTIAINSFTDTSTGSDGNKQLEAFLNLPSAIFQITSVSTSYTLINSPYVPHPNNRLYADACGWENDPNDLDYPSCGGGDYVVGGTVTTTYQVKVLKIPTAPLDNPMNVSPLIYDFSAASFHYNNDYDVHTRQIIITDPTQIQMSKSFAPDNITSGGISTLTFIITNPTDNIISNVYFTDNFPGGIVVAATPNVEIYGCGTGVFSPAAGATSVSLMVAEIAAHGTGTIKVDVTGTALPGEIHTYTNTSGALTINGTPIIGPPASDELTVGNTADLCVPVPIIAQWQVPNNATNPPDKKVGTITGCPTVQDPGTLTATADAGIPSQASIVGTGSNDGHSWEIWATGSAGNYVEFNIDTRNYSQIKMSFAAKRQNDNSATSLKIYYNKGFGAQQNGEDLSITSDKNWHTHAGVNQLDFTGKTNTSGITTFRIQPMGTDNDSRICFDYITFSGVTCYPPPTFTKYFDPDSVLVTTPPNSTSPNVSLLTFVISNTGSSPNASQTLHNVMFRDILPNNIQIYNDGAYQYNTCPGSTLTIDNHLGSEILFNKSTMDFGEVCTATVYVIGTSPLTGVQTYVNTTEPITSSETPNNKGTASASITVTGDPVPSISILKQVSPTGAANSWRSYLAVPVGGEVYYRFIVENTCDVPLTNVKIEDPPGETVIYPPSGIIVTLAAGDSLDYVSGPITAVAGTHVNTAQASGTYNGVTYSSNESSATYDTNSSYKLTLVKIAEEDHFSSAGDVLHYTYTVANIGTLSIDGPVTIIDDIAQFESCQALNAIGNHDNYFDPGENLTCTATYQVDVDDVILGSVTNTAYAASDGVASNTVSLTVNATADEADLEVVKSCKVLTAGQPDDLAFIITLTNKGPNIAQNVELYDSVPSFLSDVKYTLDSDPTRYNWNSPLPLPDMDPADQHMIRIYGDVSDPLPSPIPQNTATVTSDTPDLYSANNSSTCTSEAVPPKRQALQFPQSETTDCFVTVDDQYNPGDPGSLDLTGEGTIEAWIYPQEFTGDAGIVFKGASAGSICYGLGLGGGSSVFTGGASSNIGFIIVNSSGTRYLLTATRTTLKLNRWYHVACVWNTTAEIKMVVYIDGLAEAARIDAIDSARTNTDDLLFGIRSIPPAALGKFSGVVDEVRVWNTVRTRTQIRDYMCKKLSGAEYGLAGYWRFDEASGDTCVDSSGHSNAGIITNAIRLCSEAPLGDASLWDYNGIMAGGGYTVNLASPYGDNITVTEDGGTWSVPLRSGLQVYRVDDAPTPSSAPLGWKSFTSAHHYWGVFITGGTSPTYQMLYNYTGYPGILNEDALQMAYRHRNCETWKVLDAKLNTPVDTLTKDELSGTEFILGSYMDPRNAIDYDGTDDYVTVADDATLDLSAAGTLEAWIYIDNHTANGGIIHKGDDADTPNNDEAYFLRLAAATNQIVLGVNNGAGVTTLTSTTTLNPDTWYHVAGVWDNTAPSMDIYINGVNDGTQASASTAQSMASKVNIGQQFTFGTTSYCPFDGYIDEVRVWNVARTQTDVRNTMCKKVTTADAGFSNLMGYWRFDEETASTISPDYTGNGNDGTMTNFADVRTARICSSAPIGDGSAYDYYDSGIAGTVSAQLAHTDGDYMFGTEIPGNWTGQFSGIQIYRLDESPVYPPDLWHLPDYPEPPYGYITPNGLTPPAGWSSIDYYRYWGVFVTDWDDTINPPEYDVVYHYTGNPMVPVDDSVVALARRPEYCFGTWTEPSLPLVETLDTGGNTLTIAGDSQFGPPATNPEYVLGGKGAPLAITLASFTAEAKDGCVDVAWETATEINTAGFYIWRSDNPLTDFVLINSSSLIPSNSVIESMGAKYAIQDCGLDFTGGKTYYYKLEEIVIDSTGDGNMHGPIGPVSENVTAIQSSEMDSKGKGCFISILTE